MEKFAINIGPSGSTFVKEYNFFVSQGGEKEPWGKHWKVIEANDIYHARIIAIQQPGARPGLYCANCGHEDIQCVCERKS